MNIEPYVDSLRDELATAADAGGAEARALAERLTAAIGSATRLVLLQALTDAADEITRELAPGSVEVRLRGRDPEFVVTPAPATGGDDEPDVGASAGRPLPPLTASEDDDGSTSRLNLRLPESLKVRIEDAAKQEGLSLNAWLVRAAAAAVEPRRGHERRSPSGGQSFKGWVS